MANRARLRIDVDEFRRALQDLPQHLGDEAREIVHFAAEGVGREILEAYPQTPDNDLKQGMRVVHKDDGPLHARSIVENTSHLSNWYENGTQERHTKLGRNRGRMPPAHVFVPRIIRARRRMEATLVEMVIREGLIVR
jgi:hypothetical protein